MTRGDVRKPKGSARARKPQLTRAELMEAYIEAERTVARTDEFLAWLITIRKQAPPQQQIEGGQ